jgi:hypothetical protein
MNISLQQLPGQFSCLTGPCPGILDPDSLSTEYYRKVAGNARSTWRGAIFDGQVRHGLLQPAWCPAKTEGNFSVFPQEDAAGLRLIYGLPEVWPPECRRKIC